MLGLVKLRCGIGVVGGRWALGRCAASFLIDAAEARHMDLCSYEDAVAGPANGAEQVGFPSDASLSRENTPVSGVRTSHDAPSVNG